jgi:hypothetical protein
LAALRAHALRNRLVKLVNKIRALLAPHSPPSLYNCLPARLIKCIFKKLAKNTSLGKKSLKVSSSNTNGPALMLIITNVFFDIHNLLPPLFLDLALFEVILLSQFHALYFPALGVNLGIML